MRERVLALFINFRAAFAEDPVLDLLDEFRAFFNDRLVGRRVAVVGDEASSFKRVDELFGREFTRFAAEFFTDRDADSRRGLSDDNAVLRVKDAFDLVDEAHLFDGVERAGDEALAAVNARVVNDLVLGAETALNGIGRAEFAAGVATDAVILVDMDDAAQFTLAKVALEGGTVLAVGIVARQERTNRGRHGYILR